MTKRKHRFARMAAGGLLCMICAMPAMASDHYSITGWVIAGGGAIEATGGGWTLSGTIGQWEATEAHALAGGPWRLTGGFWGLSLEELADFLFQDRFEANINTSNPKMEFESNS